MSKSERLEDEVGGTRDPREEAELHEQEGDGEADAGDGHQAPDGVVAPGSAR